MLLDQRTLAILAYCHFRLVELDELTKQGHGESVLEDKEEEKFINDLGDQIIKFCEDTRATKEGLEDRINSRARAFYLGLEIYYNAIQEFYGEKFKPGDQWIPILFIIAMIRELHLAKMINLDLDYARATTFYERAEYFNKDLKPSKFKPDLMVADKSEFKKYEIYAAELLKRIFSIKINRKVNSKHKKKKRSRA